MPKALLLALALLSAALPAAGRSSWTLDADETSSAGRWKGGAGTLQVGGTFAGGPTVTFEWTAGPPVSTWLEIDAGNCTFAAPGRCNFVIGNGDIRVVVTGGTGAGIVTAVVVEPFQASIGPFLPLSIASDSAAPGGSLAISSAGNVAIPGTLSVNAGDADELGISLFNINYGLGIDGTDLVFVGAGGTGFSWKKDTVAGALVARLENTTGNFGLGISPADGKLHAWAASAGTVTASTAANLGVFEAGATNGISILTPDASTGGLVFGSPTDNDAAGVYWSQTGGFLILSATGPAGTDLSINATSGLVALPSNIGAFPPATCSPGALWVDTDETDDTNCVTALDNAICVCVAADTWVEHS